MSIEKVKEYFEKYNMADRIKEFDTSTATSRMAADAMNISNAQICKTITFESGDGCIMIQTSGDTKIKNSLFKKEFGIKPKLIAPELVKKLTGYEIGGVCAFAIQNPKVKIYMDTSLKRFEKIYPACGSNNSIAELTLDELEKLSNAIKWVSVAEVRE